MKKAVMDHAMAAELESPEYTPAATRRLFMDPEVYCAVISVAVAHGVAKLLDKEERRKTITAKTQAMRDFFAEMAEGEMNEINGTPVLKMLDGQVNEEFGAWTPITTSLQGWVDLMKNIAQGLSTESISELALACKVADNDLVTEDLVERARAEFEAHVDHMCRMKYGEIDAGIEKTRADWHQEKQEMEPIMNARDNAPALPAIDGTINAAHGLLMAATDALSADQVAAMLKTTKKAATAQLKELQGLGFLESELRKGGTRYFRLVVVTEAKPGIPVVADDGCGACGDACASNDGNCRAKEESPPVPLDEPAEQAAEDLPAADEMPPADPVMLASANRMLSDRLEGVAHALRGCGLPDLAEISGAEDLQMATAALSGAYQMVLADKGALDAERLGLNQEVRSLLGIIADIRAAIGDPEGKIMLGDLAAHIQRDIGELIESLGVEKRVSGSAISAVASFCERLGCDDHNGPAPALRAIDEMRKKIAHLTDEATSTAELHKQITSLTTDVTNTRRALNDALNEADRMRTELAIERQARQALQEQINAAPAVAPKAYSIDCAGQVVTGSKTGDSAIKAAERLAKKNGSPAKITAHVPFGTVNVVKGVEFKAAKVA